MRNFLAILVVFSIFGTAQAERLPSLKPMSSPAMIAETILDLPNAAPEKRFVEEAPKPAPKTVEKEPVLEVEAVVLEEVESAKTIEKAIENEEVTEVSLPAPAVVVHVSLAEKRVIDLTADEMLAQMHFFASEGIVEASYKLAKVFLEEHMSQPHEDEALYYAALYAPKKDKRGQSLQKLKVQHEHSPWTRAAAYATIWNFAQTQNLTSIFSDERAQELKQRVNQLPLLEKELKMARLANIIPGGGHAMYHDWVMGAIYLLLSAFLLWAVLYALMWGHLPYMFIFGLLIIAVNAYSFKSLTPLVSQRVAQERASAFEAWDDLKPQTPQEILEDL